jgi:hypothetical protein
MPWMRCATWPDRFVPPGPFGTNEIPRRKARSACGLVQEGAAYVRMPMVLPNASCPPGRTHRSQKQRRDGISNGCPHNQTAEDRIRSRNRRSAEGRVFHESGRGTGRGGIKAPISHASDTHLRCLIEDEGRRRGAVTRVGPRQNTPVQTQQPGTGQNGPLALSKGCENVPKKAARENTA